MRWLTSLQTLGPASVPFLAIKRGYENVRSGAGFTIPVPAGVLKCTTSAVPVNVGDVIVVCGMVQLVTPAATVRQVDFSVERIGVDTTLIENMNANPGPANSCNIALVSTAYYLQVLSVCKVTQAGLSQWGCRLQDSLGTATVPVDGAGITRWILPGPSA